MKVGRTHGLEAELMNAQWNAILDGVRESMASMSSDSDGLELILERF